MLYYYNNILQTKHLYTKSHFCITKEAFKMFQDEVNKMENKKQIKIEISQEQILKQIRFYLDENKIEFVEGLFTAIGFNTFHEYLETIYKFELITLEDLSIMYIQYYYCDVDTLNCKRLKRFVLK